MCAGPQVTNCCLQLFLLSMGMWFFLKENILVCFHSLAYIQFIIPVLFLHVSDLIFYPILPLSIAFDNSKQTVVKD